MDVLAPYLDQLKAIMDLHPFFWVFGVCIGIGACLKKAKFFADERIPLVMLVLGAALYPTFAYLANQDYARDLIAKNAVLGAAMGWSSIGAHQMIKQNRDLLEKIPLLGLAFKFLPNGNTEILTKPPETNEK